MTLHQPACLTSALLILCLMSTGCTSLTLMPTSDHDTPSESKLKESPQAAMFRAIQTARQTNSIVLQVEGSEKPLRVLPLPEDGKTVFMNDLIRQMNLKSNFNSLDMTLFRSSGDEMDGVKMAVTFERKSGRVSAGTDYALRPGDRVTVRKVLNSNIQSFVDGLVPTMTRR